MLKQLFARHITPRGLAASRRQRAAARYQMLGETLERRSMFAVSASVSAGTLNIALGADGDAAFLSYTGSAYTLTNGAGDVVAGSPFTGVTAAVSVTGATGNQSFTFNGSTALPVSLSVADSMESATISQTIAATGLSGSTVSLSSAAITLGADISTAGAQTYGGAVLLFGSPSITSTGGAVSFQSTVDTYFGVAMASQTTFATGTNPFSVATGDLNGDGKPDLAISSSNYYSNSVSVLLNTTSPGATTPSYAAPTTFATGRSPYSVSIGDLNGDGKPDLAIANTSSDSVSVLLNTTTPGATAPSYAAQTTFATGTNPFSVSIGDLNGDGKPDLAIANTTSSSVSVLLNTTAPGATAPSYAAQTTFATGTNPISVAISDMNGDGKPDLAIANFGSDSVSVLSSTTAPGATAPSYAAQTEFATGTSPISVAISDFNGDGKPDLAVANQSSNSVSVLMNATTTGNLTVSSATGTTFAAAVGGTTPLSSLTIASGPTSIGGNVTTTGTQTYTGAVTLTADAAVTTAGGAVSFVQAVDGAKNLTIAAGAGAVSFAKAVGGTQPLASLWIPSAASVTSTSPVRLDGAALGARTFGLFIGPSARNVSLTGGGSAIRNFGSYGIFLDSVKASNVKGFHVGNNAGGGALATGDLTGTTISGSFFDGNPTGILMSAAKALTIGKGNYLQNNSSSGLAVYGDSTGSVVTGSVFYANPTGILLGNATNLTIDSSSGAPNTIQANTAQGVLATGILSGTSIQGASIYGNPTGILMSSAQGLTVGAGNSLQNSSSSGLAAYGDSTGSAVEASVFFNNPIGIVMAGAAGLQVRSKAGTPNSILSNTVFGIAVSGASPKASITGVSVSGNPTGILLSAAQGVTIGSGNYFVNSTSSGLAAYGDSAGSVVTGSVFSGNNIGVTVSGAKNLAIGTGGGTPNVLVSNTNYGVYAEGACDGTVVAGNVITANSLGVVVSAARDLTVNGGNSIFGNTNIGVFVTGDSSGTKLQGNVIDRNATGLLMSAAAGLTAGGAGGASNTITNSAGSGVMLIGACTGSRLGANVIALNGTGITLSGASGATFSGASTVANNTYYGLHASGVCTGTSFTGGSFVSNDSAFIIVAAEGLSISGTMVVGHPGFGLWATGKCTGTSIVGNMILGNGTNIETSTTTAGTFQAS